MALSGEPDGRRNGSRHVLRQFSRPSGGLREGGLLVTLAGVRNISTSVDTFINLTTSVCL